MYLRLSLSAVLRILWKEKLHITYKNLHKSNKLLLLSPHIN